MEFTIENAFLKATIISGGAQVSSVVRKSDGVEHMWSADPAVWGFHAPILFPHCGKLPGNKLIAKGRTFESGGHGFARLMEHSLVRQSEDTLVLELTDSEETLKIWPYHFRLVSTFRLEGDALHHTLTVENRDDEKMPFGIGFHPGFAVPFDSAHTFRDYELRFDRVESPICLATPTGLVSGDTYLLGQNITSIPVDEKLFANDSHCIVGLASKTLGLYEKDSTRAVVCELTGFPNCLLWSTVGEPKFVCIEPWNSLPSREGMSADWNEKPAAAILTPGESWSTTLTTHFVR